MTELPITFGMMNSLPNSDAVLAQFNRLVRELLRGRLNRKKFHTWELDLLVDIVTCDFRDANKHEILQRYQKAVQRQMKKGAPLPFKLSEYLESGETFCAGCLRPHVIPEPRHRSECSRSNARRT